MRISDVLGAKQWHEVVTIAPTATVGELVDALAEHNVGALVVSEDGVHVTGIVSERDVVRLLHRHDDTLADLLQGTVAEIMTTDVHTCAPEELLNHLMALMTERRIRHVPVVEGERLTGIISIGDVVKSRISELEFERDQLDSYVGHSLS